MRDDPPPDLRAVPEDADRDGWPAPVDCDDADPRVNPGRVEVCDGVDDDRDGRVDDEDGDLDLATAGAWCQDQDGDGYGDPDTLVTACAAPSGSVADCTDCVDTNRSIFPGAIRDDWENGYDDDCDGYVDEGAVYLGDFALWTWGVKLTGGYDGTGTAVAGAGDLDGDGHTDLLVGVSLNEDGGPGAGAGYVLYGPLEEGERSLATADLVILGAQGHGLGERVAGAGDVDDDDRDDLLLGCPGCDAEGSVWLVYGPAPAASELAATGLRIVGERPRDEAAVPSGAGDLDGDGRDDVLVGAPGSDGGAAGNGVVYVLCDLPRGPGVVSLADASAALGGEGAGDAVGTAQAGAGDVDGDGHDDVIVGAPTERGCPAPGAAFLQYGPLAGRTEIADADVRFLGGLGRPHGRQRGGRGGRGRGWARGCAHRGAAGGGCGEHGGRAPAALGGHDVGDIVQIPWHHFCVMARLQVSGETSTWRQA